MPERDAAQQAWFEQWQALRLCAALHLVDVDAYLNDGVVNWTFTRDLGHNETVQFEITDDCFDSGVRFRTAVRESADLLLPFSPRMDDLADFRNNARRSLPRELPEVSRTEDRTETAIRAWLDHGPDGNVLAQYADLNLGDPAISEAFLSIFSGPKALLCEGGRVAFSAQRLVAWGRLNGYSWQNQQLARDLKRLGFESRNQRFALGDHGDRRRCWVSPPGWRWNEGR